MLTMSELVPSQSMQRIFKEKGFVLTDFNKATIIWNWGEIGKRRDEIFTVLRDMAAITPDEILKRQIHERFAYEDKILETFRNNAAGRYVYVVIDKKGYPRGYFADYNMARNHGISHAKKDENYEIEKHLIITRESNLQVKHDWAQVGGMICSADGTIEYLWSSELEEDVKMGERVYTRPDRFEDQFIVMPVFEYHPGTAVRCLNHSFYGEYGIITEDWEEDHKWNMELLEQGCGLGFPSISVKVRFLTEEGVWSHEHINPLYLEPDNYRCEGDDEKASANRRAAESLMEYLSQKRKNADNSDRYAQKAIQSAKEYRDICFKIRMEKESKKEWNFDKVKKVEDLIC